MKFENEIQELLVIAEPLRQLDDDDAKRPLTGIVDEINKLRVDQDRETRMRSPTDPAVGCSRWAGWWMGEPTRSRCTLRTCSLMCGRCLRQQVTRTGVLMTVLVPAWA